MTTFKEIVHDKDIIKAIDHLGFETPTEIQAETIPLGIEGADIIGQAKTGSGKTFAFGIAMVHHMQSSQFPQVIVIAPTRELTQQISIELRKILKFKKINVATVYGGVSINPQIDELEAGAEIVVGTPGRLLDHLERGTLKTENVRCLVLDEADRMLDMGFIEDIESIINSLPDNRQMLLFSATMPDEIKKLAQRHLNEPHHIKTSTHVEQEVLPQFYYVVPHNKKFSLLMHLLESEILEKAIIFCATRRTAEIVAKNLKRYDSRAEELHGGMTQARRNSVMQNFRKGKIRALVATDVAARGLDIQEVSHVINYDVPQNPEDYIHRIGRTARAGKKGKAITLLEDRDFDAFQDVLNIVPQQPEKFESGDFKNYGFRIDSDNRGGPGRGGPGRGRPGTGGPRRESSRSYGGNRGGSSPRRTSSSSSKPQKGWKQSMRRR